MNRTFKFRTWNGDEMIILENAGLQYFDFEGAYALSFVVDGYDGFWAHEQYDKATKDAAKYPVMQFTGLKDYFGTDIYEGDILEENGSKNSRYEVVWDNTWAKFKLDHTRVSGAIQYPEWNRGIQMAVIGNIYETPDLIINK